MKLGILADIHESVNNLRAALEQFHTASVDQIVVLGDVYRIGQQMQETVALLSAAGTVGVWGNHDLGFCREIPERIQTRFAGPVLDYMATLQPRLEIDGCYFSHVDAFLDPEDPVQIWFTGGFPDTPERAALSFDVVPHDVLFVGHYHRWRITTPRELLDWRGEGPIVLRDGRYLVCVHAVAEGHAALFDTTTRELTPLRLPGMWE
jgi:predicted phosphodiesterase